MCVFHLTGDQNGNLYGVTETGELLHNRHRDSDPAEPLIYPGTGRRIAEGFSDIRHLISWPAPSGSHIAVITLDGTMYYNRVDDPATAAPRLLHPAIGPVVTAEGWRDLRHVFCDRTGAVYSVTLSGKLGKNRLTVSGNSATLEQPVLGSPLDPGWTDLLHVFSADPGRFLSVDLRGALRYNEEKPVDHGPPALANPGAGPPVATCWDTLVAVFGAGNGGIYGITTEGDFLYTRLRVIRGHPKLMQPGHGKSVSKGVCKTCRLSTMVEGYCWPLSVAPGETVEFKISVNPQGARARRSVSYRARYVRLRRVVRGVPGRYVDVSDYQQMSSARHHTAKLQATGPKAWEAGCNWKTSFKLRIPRDGTWRSGLYAAECRPGSADLSETDPSEQGAYYVVFIVKPPAGERGELAVLSNINTWNAYNCWGGSSKYCCHPDSPLPSRLSFERPSPGTCPSELPTRDCPEVRPQTAHLTRAELWVLTWLEDNGYPFHLYADHDLDGGIEGISEGSWRYKALILNTHPEYWTIRMYENLRRYVDGGGNLIYLGGNGIYEHVKYVEPEGRAMRVLQETSKRERATCQSNAIRCACLLRNLRRPERKILGVGFENIDELTPAPYEVVLPSHPFFADVSNRTIGTQGLYCPACGWEIDFRGKRPSRRITLLARGTGAAGPNGAEMVHRRIGKRNFVFSAGSLIFGASLVVDCDLQRVLKNVLEAALV